VINLLVLICTSMSRQNHPHKTPPNLFASKLQTPNITSLSTQPRDRTATMAPFGKLYTCDVCQSSYRLNACPRLPYDADFISHRKTLDPLRSRQLPRQTTSSSRSLKPILQRASLPSTSRSTSLARSQLLWELMAILSTSPLPLQSTVRQYQ
jgi:hypothetical protein